MHYTLEPLFDKKRTENKLIRPQAPAINQITRKQDEICWTYLTHSDNTYLVGLFFD